MMLIVLKSIYVLPYCSTPVVTLMCLGQAWEHDPTLDEFDVFHLIDLGDNLHANVSSYEPIH